MIELITGEKGKGKTKMLMAKANNDTRVTGGSIIYLDINNKHMYELSNLVRLINVSEYNVRSSEMFLGFLYGIVSLNQHLDRIFLDNFMAVSCTETVEAVETLIKEISDISEKYEIDFVIGLSLDKEHLTPYLHELITIAL